MVTPCGTDRESSWQGLLAGRSRVRWLTDAEHAQIGCSSENIRLAGAPAMLPDSNKNCIPFTNGCETTVFANNSFDRMITAAAWEAVQDSKLILDPFDPFSRTVDRSRIGLVIGTSKSSLAALRTSYLNQTTPIDLKSSPPSFPRKRDSYDLTGDWFQCWPHAPASRLAALWDIRGPVLTPVAACATGMSSICRAADLIRDGVCDIVLAGSVDDSLSDLVWGSYRRLGVLARIVDDTPGQACRPFDRDRSGFLMGAGSAVIVMESWDHAERRGKRPYAEWVAGGCLSDATALTQVSSDAAGLTRLIQDLLRRGGMRPDELDYINLHGTGTRDNDRYETQGIRHALGSDADRIPCSSLKGTIGHLLGGAGSVEFAATVLALRDGMIPPTCNLDHPSSECDLDYTPQVARKKTLKAALKLSLGFGGHLVGGLIRRV